MTPAAGRPQPEETPMSTKYLCIYRGPPSQAKPSPAEMQEMFAAFNTWKDQFKANILDMGAKLKPSGKVLTAAGVTDGPFVEGKEIVGGFMILAADDYDGALAVVQAMPMMRTSGACIEIREMASM
jgi:hypothetical protein